MITAQQMMSRLQSTHPGPPIERLGDSTFYLVRSRDLIAEVTARTEEFSSNLTATMVIDDHGTITEFPVAGLGSPIHALATADGQTHRIHRKLVLPSLTPRKLRSWAPFVDQTIRQLWAQSYDDGIDWVTEVAEKLPAAVVAELIGVPQHRRDHLLTWAFASSAILDGMVTPDELDDAVTSVGQFMAFLDEELHRARVVLPPTVVGDLARLVNNSDIDHDVATHILVQLIVAGIESTVGHLGSLAWPLGQHPEHLAPMCDDPPRRDEFIEEVRSPQDRRAIRWPLPPCGDRDRTRRHTPAGGLSPVPTLGPREPRRTALRPARRVSPGAGRRYAPELRPRDPLLRGGRSRTTRIADSA